MCSMRQFALIVVKFAVSAALLYFAISRIDLGMIADRLNQLDPSWLLVAVAIGILQIGLGAIRWQRIILLCGTALPPRQAIRFNMIAAFFSQVLPSTVGGDAARILLLGRTGAGWRIATYSVLLDRFVGVLILAALITAGLYWSFGRIEIPVGRLVLLCIGPGGLAIAGAFLALGRWRSLEQWKLTRHLAEMALLARRILFSRGSSTLIVLLSVLTHIMAVTMAWSVARAMAARLGYVDAFLLLLPVMLIASVPISIGGWGVRESTAVLAFSYAGLPESDGLIVSVLLGGITLVVGIIGGIVWLTGSDNLQISTVLEKPQQL